MAKCIKCGKLLHTSKGVSSSMLRHGGSRVLNREANIFWCKNKDCDAKGIFNKCNLCGNLYDSEQPDRGEHNIQCPHCRKKSRQGEQ